MTAFTLTETLSRVITSWGGTSMVIVRRLTFTILSMKGIRRTSPGPEPSPPGLKTALARRPNRKMTPARTRAGCGPRRRRRRAAMIRTGHDAEEQLEPSHGRLLGSYARRARPRHREREPVDRARPEPSRPPAPGPSSATARHSSPSISTCPSGSSARWTTPDLPTMPAAPVDAGR